MKISRCAPTALALVPALLHVACQSSPPQGTADDVRRAESAFARTMADRDINAFESFIAHEAVFFGNGEVLRGVDAITEGWSAFFEQPEAPFFWEPQFVEVLDSGNLALSSGPVFGPDSARIGTFNSVWRLGSDGRWQVVFDKGCPPCDCDGAPVPE